MVVLELANVINYLKEQITLIRPQAEESNRAALDFGYENALGLLDGLPISGNLSGAASSKKVTLRGSE